MGSKSRKAPTAASARTRRRKGPPRDSATAELWSEAARGTLKTGTTTRKVSVTLEATSIERARQAAGPRGLSSYLDAALEEKLERDERRRAFLTYLDELELADPAPEPAKRRAARRASPGRSGESGDQQARHHRYQPSHGSPRRSPALPRATLGPSTDSKRHRCHRRRPRGRSRDLGRVYDGSHRPAAPAHRVPPDQDREALDTQPQAPPCALRDSSRPISRTSPRPDLAVESSTVAGTCSLVGGVRVGHVREPGESHLAYRRAARSRGSAAMTSSVSERFRGDAHATSTRDAPLPACHSPAWTSRNSTKGGV